MMCLVICLLVLINLGTAESSFKRSPDEVTLADALGNLPRNKRQAYCNGKYSQADRDAILKYHNDMRSKIALGQYLVRGVARPSAVNIRKLDYSCLLENSAQEVANRCIFAHSHRDGTNTGENIYRFRTPIRASPNPIPIEGTGYNACKAWEVEFEKFGWPGNRFTEYSLQIGIGHATQMAWWKTAMIGCGVAQCSDGTRQIILAVCHYRDTGNWFNEDIYKSGRTCSECGDGWRCDTSTGLCISST
ncbi:SCP domain-containing protein [Trichostrongylus colubriformis]|uniref:SCP domain-containing protein n=1 Tax=Trichostrongylus colubriformis TaxID=6319 RepID=A0AAN8FHG1_TRICO